MVQVASITWFIANLLHPLMLSIVWREYSSLSDYLGIFFYSLPLSIPSLLLSIAVLLLLAKLKRSIKSRYILWLLAIPVIVFLNVHGFMLFITGELTFVPFILQIAMAPALAAFVASLLCGPYFFKQMKEIETKPENKREAL